MKKLIVSNYNSDLEWLKTTYDHGFSSENIIIYDRSDVEKNWSHLGTTLRSPNVGENIYDMMRFIVENYNNLPNISIFIKGNLSFTSGKLSIISSITDFPDFVRVLATKDLPYG
jgi:hypothetical protein